MSVSSGKDSSSTAEVVGSANVGLVLVGFLGWVGSPDGFGQPYVECWVVMSWEIWNARNKFYFEKFKAHPRSILNGALGFFDEYQSSEACGCTFKLLILFVTFVCSGFTCTLFPPICFFVVSSYFYSHCLSPIWLNAQRFYFVYFQLSI